MNLAPYLEWRGTADQLAALASDLTAGDPRFRDQPPPTARVVRDYVQRQIVDAPEHRGRKAFYGHRQLAQLLAARVLAADNWPLRKIAEALPRMGNDRLTMILGGSVETRASKPSPRNADDYPAGGLVAGMVTSARTPFQLAQDMHYAEVDRLEEQFEGYAEDILRKRYELEAFRETFCLEGEPPEPEAMTRFVISNWLELLVDARELKSLTFVEADLVGKAVTATLYRHMTKETN